MSKKQLEAVINLIKENPSEALNEFKKFLEENKNIGSFDKEKWAKDLRYEVYQFGDAFKHANPDKFLKEIDTKKQLKDAVNGVEFYDFIQSEVLWNFFDLKSSEFNKSTILSFIEKYPYNPEFHHSYSHILEQEEKFEEAINSAKCAVKLESDNTIFIISLSSKIIEYFDKQLSLNNVAKAEELLKEHQNIKIAYNNNLTQLLWITSKSLTDRLKNYRQMNLMVEDTERKVDQKARESQYKMIEILGIFSAITGFILTNITIVTSSNLALLEILALMLGMTIALLVFSLSISFLIRHDIQPKKKYTPIILGILTLVLLLAVLIWLIKSAEKTDNKTPLIHVVPETLIPPSSPPPPSRP